MRKIFTLFSVLLPILFSIQIAYASPLNDKIIIQQLQYDETTQNYTAINIKYNDKESTVPYITEKTDIIDKPVVFSEGGRNFIFISINSHLGTGLYRTNALIFDTDTLQPLTVKKDNDFIRQNFSSQISYSDKKIYLYTANQTIILQNKSRLNDIFTAYQKILPSLPITINSAFRLICSTAINICRKPTVILSAHTDWNFRTTGLSVI